ncbi:CD63 antigen-like [Planococcus citri]|uniref:CD63 antigen-like n=1 Tax=Planococcus citri TaxID=170843 RepID=UPI0031F93406
MDLGLTTFLFLIINCILMILGIAKIVIAIILTIISLFTFTHIKEASFCAYISNAVIYGMNEIAIFVLGILAGNKNNVRFINTYLVFVLLLILSKFFSLHHMSQMEGRMKEDLNFSLTDAMADQRAQTVASSKADDIQRDLQCCGTDGPGFWTRKNITFPIPKSCCPSNVDSCDASKAYKEGCYDKVVASLPRHTLAVYKILMIPACEIILFLVGVALVIMVIRTSSNSLA